MEEIQKVEYNGVLVLTTQQIAEAYGTSTDTVTKNFNRNKDRYVNGKHYISLEGAEKNDFVDRGQFDRGLKNAKTLYLWTQKGAFLHAKSLNTDTAWEVYDRLVDSYFDKKENITVSELSPELQMFKSLWDMQAKQELEQKRQAEEIAAVKQTVTNIKKELTTPIGDWKIEINSKIRAISIKSGIAYETIYRQMYGELENTAHCSLKRLQENKTTRMKKSGNSNTAIKEATTKIAVIEDNPRLKAIFENIVRRYAVSYCA